MEKIAEWSDPSETGLSRSSVLTTISVDKKTGLHKYSVERLTSEVSSQHLVQAVPWRRDKDSCRIQVPCKPYACPELCAAEVCDVPGTGYVRIDRERPIEIRRQNAMFLRATLIPIRVRPWGSHPLPNCSHLLAYTCKYGPHCPPNGSHLIACMVHIW